MRVHKILPRTRANGPGVRFGIWVQGCSLLCRGCINPETHNSYGGSEISIQEILNQIQNELTFIEGVSISGGEPLDQAKELLDLAANIRTKFDLSIILWTGYEYHELESMDFYSDIVKYIDVTIVGRYIDKLRSLKGLKGSMNQEYVFHTSRYSTEDLINVPIAEVLFDTNCISITGINPKVMKRWY